jgi:hypothetical protein
VNNKRVTALFIKSAIILGNVCGDIVFIKLNVVAYISIVFLLFIADYEKNFADESPDIIRLAGACESKISNCLALLLLT